MMRCAQCQHENRPQAKFCEECAAPLAQTCAKCGTQLSVTAKFCPECAHPVAANLVTQARFTSPETYTPKHLAEKILTSKSALEGERKQVTVLFVDIVDSTRLAGALDAEAMHELLDRALRLMAEAVHRYDGTVNQFLGDGLMALFGAPLALEDHALRAAEAAFAIQETMSGLADQLRRERGIDVRVRVGLNSGLVVVGKIGDDLRMDYTAQGETVNLAARLQQAAPPGGVRLSEATMRLVTAVFVVEPAGAVALKGLPQPVPTFSVTRERSGRAPFDLAVERGLTPFIGRRRELAFLRDGFEKARSGRGNVVSVEHHREGMDVPVAETEVELTLVTRDEEHCLELVAALERRGYPVERLR